MTDENRGLQERVARAICEASGGTCTGPLCRCEYWEEKFKPHAQAAIAECNRWLPVSLLFAGGKDAFDLVLIDENSPGELCMCNYSADEPYAPWCWGEGENYEADFFTHYREITPPEASDAS